MKNERKECHRLFSFPSSEISKFQGLETLAKLKRIEERRRKKSTNVRETSELKKKKKKLRREAAIAESLHVASPRQIFH